MCNVYCVLSIYWIQSSLKANGMESCGVKETSSIKYEKVTELIQLSATYLYCVSACKCRGRKCTLAIEGCNEMRNDLQWPIETLFNGMHPVIHDEYEGWSNISFIPQRREHSGSLICSVTWWVVSMAIVCETHCNLQCVGCQCDSVNLCVFSFSIITDCVERLRSLGLACM